jgi:hypothetical protein
MTESKTASAIALGKSSRKRGAGSASIITRKHYRIESGTGIVENMESPSVAEAVGSKRSA